jgi:hypothetical protein
MTLYRILTLSIAWLMLSTAPAFAGDLVVTRYFSGIWDQPQHESQGLMLQIIDQEEEGDAKAVAYWFTYDDNLETAWYMGIGVAKGNQVQMNLYSAENIGFMEDNEPGNENVRAIGNLTLTFRNCNHGTAEFDTAEDIGSGEFDIKRIAGLYNSRCSGGISDNTPSNRKPVKMDVWLDPARDGITGKGKAQFWERVDRSDLHVNVEDIPDGDYDLHVCEDENPKGVITVSGGEGSLQFRSPEAANKKNLWFEPQGCRVEVHDAEGVVLSSGDDVLAARDKGNNGGGNGNGHSEISVDLENTGLVAGLEDAVGEATLDFKNNKTDFEVEIQGVPSGFYPLWVANAHRGDIEVTEDGEKGKLKFSDMGNGDKLPLDFLPIWGEWIEVYAGDDVLLEVQFPNE